jgi:prevent-host-death family protein
MTLTATELRSKLFRVLDQVAQTGDPVEIRRRGKTLKIVLDSPPDKMDRLVPRDKFLKTNPDEIVHLDWSDQWKP